MNLIKTILPAALAVASLVFLNGCATTKSATKRTPVQVGTAQYHGQTIPVFDMNTVGYDAAQLPRARFTTDITNRVGVAGDVDLLVVVDEKGTAVDFKILDTTETELATSFVSYFRDCHFYPLKDETGKPVLHALKKSLSYDGPRMASGNGYDHPYLNHAGW